jgi:hypothetical protein
VRVMRVEKAVFTSRKIAACLDVSGARSEFNSRRRDDKIKASLVIYSTYPKSKQAQHIHMFQAGHFTEKNKELLINAYRAQPFEHFLRMFFRVQTCTSNILGIKCAAPSSCHVKTGDGSKTTREGERDVCTRPSTA